MTCEGMLEARPGRVGLRHPPELPWKQPSRWDAGTERKRPPVNAELKATAERLRAVIEEVAFQCDMMDRSDPRLPKFREALHFARAGLASLTETKD